MGHSDGTTTSHSVSHYVLFLPLMCGYMLRFSVLMWYHFRRRRLYRVRSERLLSRLISFHGVTFESLCSAKQKDPQPSKAEAADGEAVSAGSVSSPPDGDESRRAGDGDGWIGGDECAICLEDGVGGEETPGEPSGVVCVGERCESPSTAGGGVIASLQNQKKPGQENRRRRRYWGIRHKDGCE